MFTPLPPTTIYAFTATANKKHAGTSPHAVPRHAVPCLKPPVVVVQQKSGTTFKKEDTLAECKKRKGGKNRKLE